MTFLHDLERTEIFMMYREAKNELDSSHYRTAVKLFQQLTYRAPLNILYHVYLARALASTGKFLQAKKEYATAIMIGSSRTPPLYMRGIKNKLDSLLWRKSPLLYRIFRYFFPKEYILPTLPDEQMRQDTNRAISNLSYRMNPIRQLLLLIFQADFHQFIHVVQARQSSVSASRNGLFIIRSPSEEFSC